MTGAVTTFRASDHQLAGPGGRDVPVRSLREGRRGSSHGAGPLATGLGGEASREVHARGDAVEQHMVSRRDEREPAALEALDEMGLPQGAVAVEALGVEPTHVIVQLLLTAWSRQADPVNVVGEIDGRGLPGVLTRGAPRARGPEQELGA